MRKNFIISFVIILFAFFFINVSSVSAKSTSDYDDFQVMLDSVDPSCTALLGDPDNTDHPAYFVQYALNVIKYVGIVLCIVLTVKDIFTNIFKEDKDMYKEIVKMCFNRLCYAVFLFFLPILVNSILSLIGIYGTCGIS